MRLRDAILIGITSAGTLAQAQVPSTPDFPVGAGNEGWNQAVASCQDDAGGTAVVRQLYASTSTRGITSLQLQRFDAQGQPSSSALIGSTTDPRRHFEDPAVACGPDGEVLVVWSSLDGSLAGVSAQSFDRQSQPLGEIVWLSPHPGTDQYNASAAVLGAGGYLVVWETYSLDGAPSQDGDFGGIVGRRVDRLARPLTGETVIPSSTDGHQSQPSASSDQAGRPVVVWMDHPASHEQRGVRARLFDEAGVPQGADFQLGYTQTAVDTIVHRGARGEFVALWGSGSSPPWYGRAFHPSGAPRHLDPFLVGGQHPDVTVDPAGDLVLTWHESQYCKRWKDPNCGDWGLPPCECLEYQPGPDGDQGTILVQQYRGDGTPVGEPEIANAGTAGDQSLPTMASGLDGGFTLIWSNASSAQPATLVGRIFEAAPPAELQLNSVASGDQTQPALACRETAGGVAVWRSELTQARGAAIQGQVYDAAGEPVGAEVRLDGGAAAMRSRPAVARSEAGRFVAAWESAGQDGSGLGVYARLFDAAAAPAGGELRLSGFVRGDQSRPAVAMAPSGTWWAAWQSEGQDGSGTGVYAQRFDNRGRRLGRAFRVNTATEGDQQAPAACVDGQGRALIVWQGPDGRGTGIFGQRYEASGRPLGRQFRVSGRTARVRKDPAVACRADGGFAVGWTSQRRGGPGDVYLRQYDRSGTALFPEFRANTVTAAEQGSVALVHESGGLLLAAWQSEGQDGDAAGVYARYFDEVGLAHSGELRVSTVTRVSQGEPAVCSDRPGAAQVVWQDGAAEADGRDGSGWGIFGRGLEMP